MARKPLPYIELLNRRGVQSAQERLQKNQVAFDAKVQCKMDEIAEIESQRAQDAAEFAFAVKSFRQCLSEL